MFENITGRRSWLVPALLLAALTASAASANPLTYKLALEVNGKKTAGGERDASKSMARRVEANLLPTLESMGYDVHRVHDAQKAVRKENFHLGLRLDVGAMHSYFVHQAHQYEELIVSDHDTGVEVWATYEVFSMTGGEVATGQLLSVVSELHELGGGRPVYDDEEAVARRFAIRALRLLQLELEGRL